MLGENEKRSGFLFLFLELSCFLVVVVKRLASVRSGPSTSEGVSVIHVKSRVWKGAAECPRPYGPC